MLTGLVVVFRSLALICCGHRAVALENVALRQQLAVFRRTGKRPQLRNGDRLFWVLFSKAWQDWRTALVVVHPDTVVRWHRQWLRHRWTQRSAHARPGRPSTNATIRTLVGQMCAANPLWGAPGIPGELIKLGIDVSKRTVSRLLRRRGRPPSQTWRTFLTNRLTPLVSLDFFNVQTLTGRVLFVLVLLSHHRRRIVHVRITEHPTAEWTAQQIIEAFPENTAPRWLLRDRDAIYGELCRSRVAGMGIGEVVTSPSSPWQNPYVERLSGSIRRECLDHVIVVNETHLRRTLARYVSLSLAKTGSTPSSLTRPSDVSLIFEGLMSQAILQGEPNWDALPADVPADVRTLLRKCFDKAPSRRWQNFGDVRMELARAISAQAEHSPPRLVLILGTLPVVLMVLFAPVARPMLWPGLEWAVYDRILRWSTSPPPDSRVVIVEVDERSLATIGQWPWRRDVIGRLIEQLRDLGAGAIALDILFAEPDRSQEFVSADAGSVRQRTPDEFMADSLRAGKVVLGHVMTFDPGARTVSNYRLHPSISAFQRRWR